MLEWPAINIEDHNRFKFKIDILKLFKIIIDLFIFRNKLFIYIYLVKRFIHWKFLLKLNLA